MAKIGIILFSLILLIRCGGMDSSLAIKNGMVKYEKGDFKGALEEFNRASESDPQNAGAYSGMAMSKEQLGDFKGALKDYEKYFSLKKDGPDKAKAYWSSGHIKLNNTMDFKGAIEDFDKSIKLNPQDANCYVSRGIAKMNLENLEGALEDCNTAINMKKLEDPISGLTIRGMVKEKMQDYDGAIDDFMAIAQLDPNSGLAYYGIGRALIGLEDSQACEYLTKAYEMGFTDAQALLTEYCN